MAEVGYFYVMHKPWHTLFFGIAVFFALGMVSITFPESGIKISSETTVIFPSLTKLFNANNQKKDISQIIAAANSDTLETPLQKKDSVVKLISSIQMQKKEALNNFFDALKSIKSSDKSIRVLHYGDSQIEGDRISDYLRLKFQGQFGGQGQGLISLMPISPNVTSRVTNSSGWDRYNIFTFQDKRVQHSNYGVMAGFARFKEYKKNIDTVLATTASMDIETTKFGGSTAMAYKKMKLFYGGSKTKTWCEFYEGPALISADSLEVGGFFKTKEFLVAGQSNSHRFKFTGKDSPDFYGLSLESNGGVMVDNIPLRGSSGTFFHQINAEQLKTFYDYLNVKLIILQFGGNVLPSIKDASMAVSYGSYIRYQISIVKKLAPQASILFIGPADMSVKSGTDYVTCPYMEETRNAIKKVVLENGCAFFDMYDCMGGRNSMPAWVEQKLAASDYTHFSPQGARKMATLLYTALIREYNNYVK